MDIYKTPNQELTEWFFETYEKLYAECLNQTLAYEAAEQKFLNRYNHYRYASFNSFAVCKYKRTKKLLSKKT